MKPIYVYVTPFFPSPKTWRGSVGYDFVRALAATGKYDVRVFVPGRGMGYEYGGIKVFTFLTRQLPSAMFPFLFAKYNQNSFLSAIERAGIRMKDIAVCHGNTALFAIYPLIIKEKNPHCLTLLHHHCLTSFGLTIGLLRHFWPYKVYLFPVLRSLHEKMDCHLFVSEAARQSFLSAPDASWTCFDDYKSQMRGLSFYRPAQIRKSFVLHNGVDDSIFNACRVPVDRKSFTIGCIGNFTVLKNQITLIKAVGLLQDKCNESVCVRFVGSGKLLPQCVMYVKSKLGCDKETLIDNGIRYESDNLAFEFLCEVRHEKLPQFYHSLDLFVLPSYAEGFGCVFTEAFSCGVPFITCEGQGMDDYIYPEDRKKWLVPPKSPERLAEAIFAYWENRYQQRVCCAISAREIAEDYVKTLAKVSNSIISRDKEKIK